MLVFQISNRGKGGAGLLTSYRGRFYFTQYRVTLTPQLGNVPGKWQFLIYEVLVILFFSESKRTLVHKSKFITHIHIEIIQSHKNMESDKNFICKWYMHNLTAPTDLLTQTFLSQKSDNISVNQGCGIITCFIVWSVRIAALQHKQIGRISYRSINTPPPLFFLLVFMLILD